jgi:selenide,water dikinase
MSYHCQSIFEKPSENASLEQLRTHISDMVEKLQTEMTEHAIAAAIAAMTALNDGAAEAAREAGVRGATDITGFGLLGHLNEMLAASGVAAEIWAGAVPRLVGVRRLAEDGHIPGGTRRNLQAASGTTAFDAGLDEVERLILADAQTSGGLLLAVGPAAAPQLVRALTSRKSLATAIIGHVTDGAAGAITVHAGSQAG